MAHELEASALMVNEAGADGHEIYIVYLYVEEGNAGYRWQVRRHGAPEPLAVSLELFSSASLACEAGRAVLEKLCSQFDRYWAFS